MALSNSRTLEQLVHEPKAFERFAIFCLESDIESAKYINDKFYEISE